MPVRFGREYEVFATETISLKCAVPLLGVSWKFLQDMLLALFWKMRERCFPESVNVFFPYVRWEHVTFSISNCA